VFASNIPVKSYAEKEDHTCPPEAVKREEDEKVSTAIETSRREEEDQEETEEKRIQKPNLSRVPL
jgi:hypothetical protein